MVVDPVRHEVSLRERGYDHGWDTDAVAIDPEITLAVNCSPTWTLAGGCSSLSTLLLPVNLGSTNDTWGSWPAAASEKY